MFTLHELACVWPGCPTLLVRLLTWWLGVAMYRASNLTSAITRTLMQRRSCTCLDADGPICTYRSYMLAPNRLSSKKGPTCIEHFSQITMCCTAKKMHVCVSPCNASRWWFASAASGNVPASRLLRVMAWRWPHWFCPREHVGNPTGPHMPHHRTHLLRSLACMGLKCLLASCPGHLCHPGTLVGLPWKVRHRRPVWQ